jgi:hypothetical protein
VGGKEKREEKCRWADSCMGMMTVAAMEKWRNGNFAMSRAWLLLPRLLTSSQQSCQMQGAPSRLASSCRCGAASAEIGNHAHSLCFRTKSHMSHANARVQDTHEKPSLAHHITSHPRFEQGGGGAVTCSRIASFKGAVESSMVWRKLCNNAYIAMATRGSMCERLAHASGRCQRCCRPGRKSCPPLVVRILLI